ncbi:MAG: dTMP kinase [Bdellovibrionales bacterium]|nr:dTMP kinase [Bdellovibrionales bacterium]
MAFIVFEGLDGSGKSTLIRKLENHLKTQGFHVLVSREPGGTPLGEEVREMLIRTNGDTPTPRTELLLYEASRAQHVDRVIRPFLEKGGWVLCDRFSASSVAFQAGGRKIREEDVNWLNQFATDGLKPTIQVLLDLSYDVSLQRREQRSLQTGQEHDRFEIEKRDFHENVRASFLNQAKNDPGFWCVLDANQSAETLFSSLIESLKKSGVLKK